MPALILLVVALLSPSRAHAQGDTGFLVPDTVVQAPSEIGSTMKRVLQESGLLSERSQSR